MDYATVRNEAKQLNETNDCAVCAVSLATGTPYKNTHPIFEKRGRRFRSGTRLHITEAVVKDLGYEMVNVTRKVNAKTVRTAVNKLTEGTFLVRTAGHILCVKDGEALDWTAGRMHRVKEVYRVVKLGQTELPVTMPTGAAVVPAKPQAPRAKVQPKGGVKATVWAHAYKVWEANGKPTDVKVVLKLRKAMMDELGEMGIKRTTASVELGNWQKEALQ